MATKRTKVTCPFCEAAGCCFCEYEGTIFVGEKELIKSVDALQSIGVKYLKDADIIAGGLEVWPDMWEHFLDEKNVPPDFKAKHAY